MHSGKVMELDKTHLQRQNSNKINGFQDQFDYSDHGGIIPLEQEASERARCAIVVKIAPRDALLLLISDL